MVRGYFSPQNYVSVSLPVSLTEKYDNWTMKLGGSVGYQSYSQDKSAYFPTNSEWQQTLETAVSNGFAKKPTIQRPRRAASAIPCAPGRITRSTNR
jgi:hypothetical protein